MSAVDILERGAVIDQLHAAFAKARQGAGRVVAISGEAGTGKGPCWRPPRLYHAPIVGVDVLELST